MEERHNDATPQRPDGSRPLDASIIPINIPKYITQITNEEAYHKNGKNAITVFKSREVTITIIALKEAEIIHPGNDEGEAIMSLQIIKGHLMFESIGSDTDLNEGEMITLHEQLSFKATAIKPTICLLTMVK
jgi:hypothetical protein